MIHAEGAGANQAAVRVRTPKTAGEPGPSVVQVGFTVGTASHQIIPFAARDNVHQGLRFSSQSRIGSVADF